MSPKVTFLVLTDEGQRPSAEIQLVNSKLIGDTDHPSLNRLFKDVDMNDPTAVQAAMQKAPALFDGAYFRAAYTD